MYPMVRLHFGSSYNCGWLIDSFIDWLTDFKGMCGECLLNMFPQLMLVHYWNANKVNDVKRRGQKNI